MRDLEICFPLNITVYKIHQWVFLLFLFVLLLFIFFLSLDWFRAAVSTSFCPLVYDISNGR